MQEKIDAATWCPVWQDRHAKPQHVDSHERKDEAERRGQSACT